MANQYTKAAKARRAEAAKRAWVTIRAKQDAAGAKQLQKTINKTVAKMEKAA